MRSTWMRSATAPTRSFSQRASMTRVGSSAACGQRAHIQSADECHALLEWSGQPGLDAVRKMITDRLPFGVVEMKTAWVTDDPERSRQLTSAISRTPLHAMNLLDIQFIVASAASYVLKRWLSSGGTLASRIPATPYPDHRYQTKLAWWDRSTFANHADPKQLSAFIAEQKELAPRLDRSGSTSWPPPDLCDDFRHR